MSTLKLGERQSPAATDVRVAIANYGSLSTPPVSTDTEETSRGRKTDRSSSVGSVLELNQMQMHRASQMQLLRKGTPRNGVFNQFNFSEQDMIGIVKELGFGMLHAGLPGHEIQYYLMLISERFALKLTIQCFGNTIWMSFGLSNTECHVLTDSSPTLSLSKMVDMNIIAQQLLAPVPTRSIEDCSRQIVAVYQSPNNFPDLYMIPAFVVLGAAGAPCFGGSVPESGMAAVIGLVVGFVTYISIHHRHIARGYEFIIGFCAAALAVLINSFIVSINVTCVCLASVLWALPGLRLTLAMTDMSVGSTVTGSSKFLSAIICAANLGMGMVGGLKLNDWAPITANLNPRLGLGKLPLEFLLFAVAVCAVPVMVLFDAKPAHLPQLMLSLVLGYGVCNVVGQTAGQFVGTWIGSFIVGISGNFYERLTGYPSAEFTLFGIVMMVPGSVGVKAVLAGELTAQLGLLTDMITIALCIVGGIFTANIFVPPSRVLTDTSTSPPSFVTPRAGARSPSTV